MNNPLKKNNPPELPKLPTDQFDEKKLQAYSEIATRFQDKTPMVVLLELFRNDKDINGHLPLISENPSVKYTMATVKLATWRENIADILGDDYDDQLIEPMLRYWFTYMISHKRRRAIETVLGVKGGDNQGNVIIEQSKRRGLFGLR